MKTRRYKLEIRPESEVNNTAEARGVLKLVILIFGLIGLGFSLVAGWLVWDTTAFLARAESTTGKVVRIDRTRSSSSGYTVVQFTTQAGRNVESWPGMRTNPPFAQPGETVTIFYDPNNPVDIRLDNFYNLWLLPVIFGSFGIVMSSVTLFLLFFRKRIQLHRR